MHIGLGALPASILLNEMQNAEMALLSGKEDSLEVSSP